MADVPPPTDPVPPGTNDPYIQTNDSATQQLTKLHHIVKEFIWCKILLFYHMLFYHYLLLILSLHALTSIILFQFEIHDEIQSWMIASITWGVCTFLLILIFERNSVSLRVTNPHALVPSRNLQCFDHALT